LDFRATRFALRGRSTTLRCARSSGLKRPRQLVSRLPWRFSLEPASAPSLQNGQHADSQCRSQRRGAPALALVRVSCAVAIRAYVRPLSGRLVAVECVRGYAQSGHLVAARQARTRPRSRPLAAPSRIRACPLSRHLVAPCRGNMPITLSQCRTQMRCADSEIRIWRSRLAPWLTISLWCTCPLAGFLFLCIPFRGSCLHVLRAIDVGAGTGTWALDFVSLSGVHNRDVQVFACGISTTNFRERTSPRSGRLRSFD
jgi:hypothetical protein